VDILFLLIPMSVVLVFVVIGIFAWALHAGQFDDLEREGGRIFTTEDGDLAVQQTKLDGDQART